MAEKKPTPAEWYEVALPDDASPGVIQTINELNAVLNKISYRFGQTSPNGDTIYNIVGGWVCAKETIYTVDVGTPESNSVKNGIVLDSGNLLIRIWRNWEVRTEMGQLTHNVFGFKGYDDDANTIFELSNYQNMISSWVMTDTTLSSSNITIDAGNDRILVNTLTIDGANDRIRSSNYVSGAFGAGFTLEPNLLEVGNIACRGIIRTAVFQKDVISAVGGSVVIRPSDVLDTDMTALDASTLTIEGNETFAVGDLLRIKEDTDDEWFEVTNTGSAPTYTVTRDKDSQYGADDNPAWPKGATVVNYGQSGDGGIYLTSSETNAPYISIWGHAGSPWDTITTYIREGNLNGYAGYSSDIYGWASYIDANNYITIDATDGISMSGTISITSFNQLPSDENLIGYWSFDDGSGTTAVDNSGNSNDATLTNTPTWLQGVSGDALSFDGTSSEYATLGLSSYPAAWSDEWSISLWIYIPLSYSWDTSYRSNILAKGTTAGSLGIIRATTDNTISAWLRTDSDSAVEANCTITRDTWYHIVGTWDGTDLKIYLNGVFQDSDTPSVIDGTPDASPFYLARSISLAGAAGDYYTGRADEPRIYNKALTASEVKALYLNPSGNKSQTINMDSLTDGTYGKVLSTSISAGQIILAQCSGDLDDVSDGSSYGKVALTDISAGHILLSACSGDLDDIDNGTYGKVLTADISAGHILLSACSGDSDDISEGASNFYAGASGADFITGSNDLDDISDGSTYGRIALTDISAGHITVVHQQASININDTTFGNAGIQLQYNSGSPRVYMGDGSNEYLKYVSGSGVEISTAAANAITIKSGGGISLEAGGDLTLTGDDADAAFFILEGSSNKTYITTNTTGTITYVLPNSDEVQTLYIGGSVDSEWAYIRHFATSHVFTGEIAITGNVTVAGNIEPEADSTRVIGAADAYWATAYIDNTILKGGRPTSDSAYTWGTSSYCWSNIYADAGVTGCSDIKWKTILGQEPLGLDFINSLSFIEYELNKNGKKRKGKFRGLIGQELEQVLIEHGYNPDDFAGLEKNEDDDGELWYGIIYEQLYPSLGVAIQQMDLKYKEKIQEMSKQINELTERVRTLS